MSNYTITFTKAAKKQFEKLPTQIQSRIAKRLSVLQSDPLPYGAEQLTDFEIDGVGFDKLFRIRMGDYRIVYAVEHQIITITIVRIKHRKEVYK